MRSAHRKTTVLAGVVSLFVAAVGMLGATTAEAQPADVRNIRPHVVLVLETAGSMSQTPDCVCTTSSCTECAPDCSTAEQTRWTIVDQALTGEHTTRTCSEEARFLPSGLGVPYSYDIGYPIPHYQYSSTTTTGNGIIDDYFPRVKFGLMTSDGVGTLITEPPNVLNADFVAGTMGDPTLSDGLFSYADDKDWTFPAANPGDLYTVNLGARSSSASEGALTTVDLGSTATLHAAAVEAQISNVRPFGAFPTGAVMEDLRYFLQNDPEVIEKVADPGPGDAFYNCRERSAIVIMDGVPSGDLRDGVFSCNGPPDTCPYDSENDVITDMLAADEIDSVYIVAFELTDATPGNGIDEPQIFEDYLDMLAMSGGTSEAVMIPVPADLNDYDDSLYDEIATILNELAPGATSRTPPVLTGLTPGKDPASLGGPALGLPVYEFLSGFRPPIDATAPWGGFLERRRFECVDGVPEAQPIEDRDRFDDVLNKQAVAPDDVDAFSGGAGLTAGFGAAYSRNLWTALPSNDAAGALLVNNHLIGDGRDKVDDVADPRIRPFSNPADDAASGIVRGMDPFPLEDTLDPTVLGYVAGDTASRDTLVNWLHGQPSSAREDNRLGDIYHSTPVVVGPIATDTEDATFNAWRTGNGFQRDPDSSLPDPDAISLDLTTRPRIVYAATNDGIVHAFLADDTDNLFYQTRGQTEWQCADGLAAGTELWGFVPPMFLDDLQNLPGSASKQWFADGDIVVRNLFDVRALDSFTANAGMETNAGGFTVGLTNVWRTVLFMTFRNGGGGMIALDITNPCRPEFLWQFTDDDLSPGSGDFRTSFGKPTAGQIILDTSDVDDVFNPRQIRSVIMLPGGEGVRDAASEPCVYSAGDNEFPDEMEQVDLSAIAPRTNRRCWHTTASAVTAGVAEPESGRAVYFIDMIEGTVIRKMDDTVFPAPVNGSISVFRGDVATIARAAYVQDIDGILWRIDLSDDDPALWSATALHDLYHADAAAGLDVPQPGYAAPTLSVTSSNISTVARGATTNTLTQQDVVILHATGNIDELDDATSINHVVSITERLTFNPDGTLDTVGGVLNWDLDGGAGGELDPGEQVTGPLDLFAGQVFFGTFNAAGVDPVNACAFEGSRIWGVSFLSNPLGGSPGVPEPKLVNTGGTAVTNLGSADVPALANTLVMGLRVAQNPVCLTLSSVSVTDPYIPGSFSRRIPTETSGRSFRLVAHLGGSTTGTDGASIGVLSHDMPSLAQSGVSGTGATINAIADVIE